MADADRYDAEVIIVGAGPVGLLLACELGLRGITVRVLEQAPGLLAHPKANTHSARAMEIYRRHGLSKALRCSGLPQNRPTDVAYFSRLFEHELHRIAMPSSDEACHRVRAGDPRWPTPEPQLRTSQMALEPLLLARAQSFSSVNVAFGTVVETIGHEPAGTSAQVLTATGERQMIRARYLVGCDGGRSLVRRKLGIRFTGSDSLEMEFLGGRMQATYFRAADLLADFPHPPTWMCWTMHPHGRSILVLIDPTRSEFLMHYQLPPEGPVPVFADRLRAAVGTPIEHEVIASAEWRAGIGLVASRFREGNCFLAGDAAHLFTPTGGSGLNTGIEDAFNLGWKLALACRDHAGEMLLDSYEAERQPIALRNVGYALELARRAGQCPASPDLDQANEAGRAARAATAAHLRQFAWQEFDTPGIQLGGRYDSSPVIHAEDGTARDDCPVDYRPDASPGGRLPHLWLEDGSAIFDQLGPEFTLLCLASQVDAADWSHAALALGIGLKVLCLEPTEQARALYGCETLLVRPDHYVAWRGSIAEDPSLILAVAVGLAR